MGRSKAFEERAETADRKRATTAAERDAKNAENTAAIKAMVEEQRRLSLVKTEKLRALREAKDAK